MTCSSEGFFLERHPKLVPVNTFTDGVFLAGCCQGPNLIDAGSIESELNRCVDAAPASPPVLLVRFVNTCLKTTDLRRDRGDIDRLFHRVENHLLVLFMLLRPFRAR